MAVKLRLRREGTKKAPFYRVVAADTRSPRDGRFIEIIGVYHPMENPSKIEVDPDRALHWLHHGAQPTSAVEKLLRITGVWEQFKPGDKPVRDRSARGARPSKKVQARAKVEPAAAPPPPTPAADTKADAKADAGTDADAGADAAAEAGEGAA